jgi:hypothetical protein
MKGQHALAILDENRQKEMEKRTINLKDEQVDELYSLVKRIFTLLNK